MPFALLLAPQPETNDTMPEDARTYLSDFISWLHDFFSQINENKDEIDRLTGNTLFEPEQIALLPDVLDEIHRDNHFDRLQELIMQADRDVVIKHGLYGAQLRWKLSNINFHLNRFIEQPSASQLNKLLSSIKTLLDSLLDTVSGGSAIKELIEAVQHALALAFRREPMEFGVE